MPSLLGKEMSDPSSFCLWSMLTKVPFLCCRHRWIRGCKVPATCRGHLQQTGFPSLPEAPLPCQPPTCMATALPATLLPSSASSAQSDTRVPPVTELCGMKRLRVDKKDFSPWWPFGLCTGFPFSFQPGESLLHDQTPRKAVPLLPYSNPYKKEEKATIWKQPKWLH